jgi:Protein of unknown function (DUF2934)
MTTMNENRDIHIAAIAYYLYRQAGCPLGDNVPGLDAWIDI